MKQRDGHDPLLERLEHVTDNLVRVGPFSFGLDGLIGLIPGAGDVAGAVLSSFIILRAMQYGAPKSAVARMMTNVAIDAAVGALPFLGDFFDFAWKANTKNLKIYRESLAGRREAKRDWGFVLLVVLGLVVIVTVPIVIAALALRAVWKWV